MSSVVILVGFLALLLMSFSTVFAEFGAGNDQCIGIPCPCKTGPVGKCDKAGLGVLGCPCKDVSGGGTTPGVCVGVRDCKATATNKGGATMDPSKLLEALKGLMEKLKGKGGGGGGSPDNKPPEQKTPDQYPNCVYNEATKTYSPIPCKNADGSVNYGGFSADSLNSLGSGGTSNIADALLKALGGSVSEQLIQETGGEETATEEGFFDETVEEDASGIGDELINLPEGTVGEDEGGDGATTKGVVSKEDQGSLQSSLVGDIYVGDSGATIFARSRDPGSNTEVAGFYGGSAGGASASQSLVGRMCSSRPWDGGFLANIIPPSFFDGLCSRAGYQVGPVISAAPPSAPVRRAAPPRKVAPPIKPSVPIIHPEVDIWAEPPNVRLGTRTYIFWTSKEVVSCRATGPSFEQNSLSGGASTVPLSQATTFTIVCLSAASTTVEDSVTVRLAL